MSKKKYYAVKVGKKTGIYDTWEDCQKQVIGYSGAEYKSFKDKELAKKFMSSSSLSEVKEYKTKEVEAIKLSKKKDTVSVYTDGSWANKEDGGKMYAGGFLIIENGEIVDRKCVNGDEEALAELRNVAGEMQATVRAIHYVSKNMPRIKNMFVFVDYIGLMHWSIPVKLGGWKRKNIHTQKYGEYLEKIKKCINIEFIHVKGHNKDRFNEEADRLAEYSKDLYHKNKEYNNKEFLTKYSYIKKNNL